MPTMDMIDRSLFYSDESGKTKLNWLCYELAMAFYDDLVRPLKKSRQRVPKEKTAAFSIYAALELRGAICRYADGEVKTLDIPESILENFFPPFGPKTTKKILNIMKNAWLEQMVPCPHCPTNCLHDRDARCYLFDVYE